MRPSLHTIVAPLLCVAFAADAEPVPAVANPVPTERGDAAWTPTAGDTKAVDTGTLPLRARLDKEAIRAAIAALPAEADPYPRRHEADTLSATPTEKFSKEFAQARLPDCLHSEGLKNQPTFFLNGFLALPFIAVAKVRGVCR